MIAEMILFSMLIGTFITAAAIILIGVIGQWIIARGWKRFALDILIGIVILIGATAVGYATMRVFGTVVVP